MNSFRYLPSFVAAAILAAVEGGILPPGKNGRFFNGSSNIAASWATYEVFSAGQDAPGSTAGETPAATPLTHGIE
jgi:hypothetical protein